MAYHIVWDNVTKVQSDVGGVEMPWVAFPKNPGSEAVSGGFLYNIYFYIFPKKVQNDKLVVENMETCTFVLFSTWILHYYEARNAIHSRLMTNLQSNNYLVFTNLQIFQPYNRI